MKNITYLAVGDIHGCLKPLNQILADIGRKFDIEAPNNRLVFLGDYIDRGADSLKVLETLIEIKHLNSNAIFLMGNHEHMFLTGTPYQDDALPKELTAEVNDFFITLKPYWATKEFLFIHGGPGSTQENLSRANPEEYIWNYTPSTFGWKGRSIVRGHSVVEEVSVQNKLISVDTGCCYGQKLSCAVLRNREGLVETITVDGISCLV